MKLSTWLLAVISSGCQLRIGDAFDVGWRMVKAKSRHNTTLRYSSTWRWFLVRYQQPTTMCVKLARLRRIVGNFEDLTGTPDETFWSRTVIAVAKLSTSNVSREKFGCSSIREPGRRSVRAISPHLLNRNIFSCCVVARVYRCKILHATL